MKAKLFVRGMKEPIELEDNEALAAQAFIIDNTKAHDAPFSIQDVWTGKKGDMKSVVFPRKEVEFKSYKVDAMEERDAVSFSREIDQDKKKSVEIWGNDKEGKPIQFNWKKIYIERNGAIKLEYSESPLGFKVDQIVVIDPVAYLVLERKIESYDQYLSKKEFASKKKVEALEQTAQEVISEKTIT